MMTCSRITERAGSLSFDRTNREYAKLTCGVAPAPVKVL
jgi:hypothetical protein